MKIAIGMVVRNLLSASPLTVVDKSAHSCRQAAKYRLVGKDEERKRLRDEKAMEKQPRLY